MTLKEQLYHFPNLDIHASIIMQMSIENRRSVLTLAKKNESKESKAIIAELDQIYDDLDHHIAAEIRKQEYEQMAKNPPGDP